MQAKSRRIAVMGLFGRPNLGNEVTLAAFLANLAHRVPDVRVACIGPRESRVLEEHALPLIDMEPLSIRRHFWPYWYRDSVRRVWRITQRATEPLRVGRAASIISQFDALVMPGTGMLGDFGQGPLDFPGHLRRWCRAAERASIPICFLSVGAETVDEPETREALRQAAELATYRSFRDREALANARTLGISATDDPVVPDLAFSLPRSTLPPFERVTWPPRSVGLGVMGYFGWNRPRAEGEVIYTRYMEKLEHIIDWLLGRGYRVRLLIGDTRAEARPIKDLLQRFGRDGGGNEPTGVIWDPIDNYEDLLRQIAEIDVLVATRLHNVLLSLVMERPPISISYSTKNGALMEAFGFGAYCQHIEDFSVDETIVQFQDLIRQPDPPISRIRERNRVLRHQVDEQYDRLLRILGWSGSAER